MTARYESIVVGIDTSELSHAVIDWAVAGARTRNVPVHIVHALDSAPLIEPATLAGGYAWPTVPPEMYRAAAEEALRHAETYALSLEPALTVTTQIQEGSPVPVLLGTARPHDLIAIGSRQLGSVRSAIFGSTGLGLLRTGHAPFVVVRGGTRVSPDAPVVVGVSPTEGYDEVLATAFEHAAAHRLPLRALLCWEPFFYAPNDRTRALKRDAHADGERWLAEVLAGWQDAYPDVKVERSLLFEYPTVALVKESVDAALVVIGVRGTRTARTLGCIASAVLHHAACPVAVVPR
ncbi:MAG TPA: universal stress protein [Nocardioides sp.]|nr:universal stress protein [Nocardioides sp.]